MSIPDAAISVLLVDNNDRSAQLTTRCLERSSMQVTWAATGPEGIAEATQLRFSAVLLDWVLPGCDGLEVCRVLRTQLDVPIIMLTARKEESCRVLALDGGADDYVTKPFSPRELVSRIRAVVRRARGQAGPALRKIQVGAIVIDPARMRVTVNSREVPLTGFEFAILKALMEQRGRVLSREHLRDQTKSSSGDGVERAIDTHISRLRQKLGDDGRKPRYLKTIRRGGYLLAAGDEE